MIINSETKKYNMVFFFFFWSFVQQSEKDGNQGEDKINNIAQGYTSYIYILHTAENEQKQPFPIHQQLQLKLTL